MLEPIRSTVALIDRLHDQAMRDTIQFSDGNMRRCHYGNHRVLKSGGVMIGGKWCCKDCKGVIK